MIDKIFCFVLGHVDVEDEVKTVYLDSGGWQDVVYSWYCARCERLRKR